MKHQVLKWNVAPNGKSIELNDRAIVHAGSIAGDGMSSDIVPQVASSVSIDELRDNYETVTTQPRSLEWSWLGHVELAADGTNAELMDVDFHVKSFNGADINTDDLTLRVLKDENDNLSIADVIKVPKKGSDMPAHKQEDEEEESTFTILPINPTTDSPTIAPPQPECTGPSARICQIKAILDSKVQALKTAVEIAKARASGKKMPHKPCPGKMMHLGHPMAPASPTPPTQPAVPVKGGVGKFWTIKVGDDAEPHAQPDQPTEQQQNENSEEPQAEPPHGHHHHKGPRRNCRMARVARALHRFFFGFVVPVLIGIAAGMTASLLGMVVGTALAMLWFVVVRGGRRGGASARCEPPAESADEDEAAMEKKGLMAEEEVESVDEDGHAPPLYQEKQ